jgi:uncharacterized protein (TIGR02453 family)
LASGHFSRSTLRFLAELRLNNDKAWFEDHRDRYERDVKAPMLAFIDDFAPRLGRISRAFVASSKVQGGSMFRIHRDVRFSPDKSPYKTHAAAQFRHVRGKDVHAPGFYLHIEPGQCFAGGGIYHPDNATLKVVRSAIDASPTRWKRAVYQGRFADGAHLGGDSLKRAPKGFSADHPLIEDLRRKDYVGFVNFKDSEVTRSDFLDRFVEACQSVAPLMRFLSQSLELEW